MKLVMPVLLLIVASVMSTQSNAQETRSFDFKGFEGIKNSTSADVYVTQSAQYSIQVTAKSNVFNEIEIVVKDNVLHIKSKDTFRIESSWGNVLVKVSCHTINLLAQNGSGDITMQTPLKVTNEFTASLNGSGDIILNEIQANSIQVSVNGSGCIKTTAKGTTDMLLAKSNGSGNINLENLIAENAQVKLNGSGNAVITCNKTFNGSINGSGNIVLYGNPIIDAKVNGSGHLVRKSN